MPELRCLKFIEDIVSNDNIVPINKTLGYDAVLYLKAFLYTNDPSKKNEVRKNLDEHITGLGAIIEACSHGQGGRTGFKLKQRRNLLDFGEY
jgi:hypothetical protein